MRVFSEKCLVIQVVFQTISISLAKDRQYVRKIIWKIGWRLIGQSFIKVIQYLKKILRSQSRELFDRTWKPPDGAENLRRSITRRRSRASSWFTVVVEQMKPEASRRGRCKTRRSPPERSGGNCFPIRTHGEARMLINTKVSHRVKMIWNVLKVNSLVYRNISFETGG